MNVGMMSGTFRVLIFDTGRIAPGKKFVNTPGEELWNLIYFCV